MKNLVIYHAGCVDGFTAAWCAWRKFGDQAEYLPAKYGDQPPDVTGRDVLIVDFSFKREVLVEMAARAASLRVLDHHKTAQAELAGLDFCVFDMERSGAGIAWDELHGGRRPLLVDYVEDRDLWRFALRDSKALNAFIGTHEQTFANWSEGAESLEGASSKAICVHAGETVLRATQRYVEVMAKHASLRTFGGFWVPVVNAPPTNVSELVGHLAETHPDRQFAAAWFQRADGKYQYSLRSRGDFDVSQVAEAFGGGGHLAAAGFEVPERVDLSPKDF